MVLQGENRLAVSSFLGILAFVAASTIAVPQGEAAAPHLKFKVSPHALRFSKMRVASGTAASESQSFTISNFGSESIELTVNSPSAPFAIASGGGTVTLAPGQNDTVSVSFQPSTAGKYHSAIEVSLATPQTGRPAGKLSQRVHLAAVAIPGSTATPTGTPAPTSTATGAPTPTPGATPTGTPAPTSTPTRTATPTPSASPTATPAGGAFPAHFFAPYVDMTLWPPFNMTNNLSSVGRYYTMAFIVDKTGNGCTASWGTYYVLSDDFPDADIANMRAAGGDVIVSFGGEANTELALSCTSVSALEAQYDAVVTHYDLKWIDFDVEGAAVADPASISRRNQALVQLQAAHPGLQISYTLPVMPYGLTQDGINVISDAIAKGVNVTTVNVMAMDYGDGTVQMGQAAINAGNATANQLSVLYPSRSTAEICGMIGVTPMIGYNDFAGEVFQISDAQLLLSYAQQGNGSGFCQNNGFGTLGFWSIARDGACPAGQQGTTQNTCSGLSQTPFEFSGIFKQINP